MDDKNNLVNSLPSDISDKLSDKSRLIIERQIAKEQAVAKKKELREKIRFEKELALREKKESKEKAKLDKEIKKAETKSRISTKPNRGKKTGSNEDDVEKMITDKLFSQKTKNKGLSKIPRSVQDSIPYVSDFSDGLFEICSGKYSKTFIFEDLNYLDASEEEQFRILNEYGRLLNHFSQDIDFAITLNNKAIDEEKKLESLLVKEQDDELNSLRRIYNNCLMKMTRTGKSNMQCEKYLTVTIDAASQYEALKKFSRIETEILRNFKSIGTMCKVMQTGERLSVLHDFFRPGQEGKLVLDFDFIKKQGISSKDYIAPESMEFYKNHFVIGENYYCSMFINNLPSDISDNFLSEIMGEADFPLIFTKSIKSSSQEKALKIVKRALTGMQKDKLNQQKKAIREGYDPDMINNDLKYSLEEAEELLNDLRKKNQKMFFVSFTAVVGGKTKDELDENIKMLSNIAGKYTCQLQKLSYQQEKGLAQTLPLGHNFLPVRRTLTTESTAIFMPFTNMELFHEDGLFYGLNAVSKNWILFDRRKLKNPAGFIFGGVGSGKSFSKKEEDLGVIFSTQDDIIIFDPEREYGPLLKEFGAEIIQISANSPVRINPMDMTRDYAVTEENPDADPISLKTEFIQAMFNSMLSTDAGGKVSSLSPQQKSIVDRCVRLSYQDYIKDFDPKKTPTLMDLYNTLSQQTDEEAKPLVGALEYYAKGSMNIFAEQTNVDVNNRIIVYDTKDLGKSLMSLGMLIIMDTVWNRFTRNRYSGKRTRFNLDEVHLVLKHEISANMLLEYIKRGRKWGAIITGITQNVSDCLLTDTAKNMLSNSGYIRMLSQSTSDLKALSELFGISEGMQGYVKNSGEGQGLLFAEGKIIPFIDKFPTGNRLYELMTTKPDEIKSINEKKSLMAKRKRREDAFDMTDEKIS